MPSRTSKTSHVPRFNLPDAEVQRLQEMKLDHWKSGTEGLFFPLCPVRAASPSDRPGPDSFSWQSVRGRLASSESRIERSL